MKVYIALDKDNIIRCLASNEKNIHKDKQSMKRLCVEDTGFLVGDRYDPETGVVTPIPENYPQPTEEEKTRRLIAAKKEEILERQARAELVSEGKIEG